MLVETEELQTAYRVSPDGKTEWVIAFTCVDTGLVIGDVVIMAETPERENVFVRKCDFSIHPIRSQSGYVLVVPHVSSKV